MAFSEESCSVEVLDAITGIDLDRLVEIWTRGFPGTLAEEIRIHAPDVVSAEKSALIVARDSLGQLASAMVANVDTGRDKRRGRIDDVATHPDCLRQGFGGLILDFAIDWFRENNVSRVHLASNDSRKPAHALYFSRGFYIHDTNDFQLDL
jgi:GNAT superfamily N-acetyltransferase